MNPTVLCVLLALGLAGARGEDSGAGVVRDLFRQMLHLQPPSDSGQSPPPTPRHMLELYQQYSSGQATDRATTVRNILPSPADGDLLLFNVSCVEVDEEVRLGQLQLSRRRLHQRRHHSRRLLTPPYRVRLYRAVATPSRLQPLASVPVSSVPHSAWGLVDITAALRELLLDPRPSRRQLAVRFESPDGQVIPPSHFLRGTPDTNAFLVVFSEDEQAEDGSGPTRATVHTHALVQKLQQEHRWRFLADEDNSPQVIPMIYDKKRRMFTRNSTTASPVSRKLYYDEDDSQRNHSEPIVRRERSLLDNKLPDDDDSPVPSTSDQTDVPVLPRLEDTGRKKPKKNKRKKEKKQKQKQKHLSPLDKWINIKQNDVKVSAAEAKDQAGACSVTPLTVNFAEIGWAKWIIAPANFDANYCSGSCHFPLTKEVRPSNHATLQSLVHALGKNPQVPEPSCVPHHLASITILYFDEAINVVLKTYHNMVVKSCACR